MQTFGTGNDLLVRLQPKEGAASQARSQHRRGRAARGVDAGQPGADAAAATTSARRSARSWRSTASTRCCSWCVGFLIYISFRFEWKFAVAAIITTLHDVVVVAGWFALSGHEFDLTVLAGVLSVMGYSINDTIVVFDRVRENFRAHARRRRARC